MRLLCNLNTNLKFKKMKKIKALMFAFVLAGMTVTSCSSDDSGPAPTIDGKWNQVKTTIKVGNQTVTQKYEDDVNGCNKNYLEFAPAGIFNEAVYFKPAGGGDCQIDIASGTWVKVDKKLTIGNAGFLSGTYDITKLSGSDMQIAVTDNGGGITSTTTIFLKKVK